MAKAKKYEWQDPAIMILVILLLVATNFIWLVVTRDLQKQVDQLGVDNFNNTVQLTSLKQCYKDGTNPCPESAKFTLPE